jgi:thiol reductant ABC exporter CydC subunit
VLSLSIAIGAVQAFALSRGLARYLQRLGAHGAALAVLGALRLRLYDLLEARVPGGLPGGSSGEVLSSFVSDANAVSEGFAKGVTVGVDVTASILIGTALALLVEPALGLVLLLGALGTVTVSCLLARLGRSAEVQEAASRALLASSVVDTMRSARELVSYGREDLVAERLQAARQLAARAAARKALFGGLARAGATATAGGALVGLIGAGLVVHDAGRLTGVMLAVVLMAALAVLDQCASLPAVLSGTSAASAAAERFNGLARLPVPVQEPGQDRGADVVPGTAALESADVAAPDGTAILRGVSLRLEPGRRTALVGPSGAGKTTAVYALLRFVACSQGRASVGGVDVSELSREAISRLVAWVAEETHVFAASLADNLRLGRPSASEAECLAALERAGLLRWYESLPEGMSTVLGAGGRPVSAGEAQRLGMARALLAGTSVFLLDEPTAHLDPTTSAEVLAELLAAAGGRSVLVVSHEPGIRAYVDEVVSLVQGQVASRSPAR